MTEKKIKCIIFTLFEFTIRINNLSLSLFFSQTLSTLAGTPLTMYHIHTFCSQVKLSIYKQAKSYED